jgi:Raf kinase inhibitor-like YbhB/YbcL family protein
VAPTIAFPTSEDGMMRLNSSAFDDQGPIPVVYTCDGEDISPPLSIDGLPVDTGSLLLTVIDPDAPAGDWVHWVVFDVVPTSQIAAGVSGLGTPGVNSWGRNGYGGPCPPSGSHRYVFRVLALDSMLGLPAGSALQGVLDAASDHVLEQATLTGTYSS